MFSSGGYMTEEEKKTLEKLKEDKEKLISLKKQFSREYEELKKEEKPKLGK